MIPHRHGMALTRRQALIGAGAVTVLLPVRVALAAGPAEKPLILVLLHGSPDGQALVPSHGDPAYPDVRGSLALPPPDMPGGILDLDGAVGLHPGLEALLSFWPDGRLHVAPAVAGPYRGDDPKVAQTVLESGAASSGDRPADGWLNRAIATAGAADGPSLVWFGGGDVPAVLAGAVPATARSLFPAGPVGPGFPAKARALYAADPELAPILDAVLASGNQEAGPDTAPATPGVHGFSALVFTLAAGELGRFMASPGGPSVATIEIGGWDTHRAQGAEAGPLARRIGALGDGLAALAEGMGARFENAAILALGAAGRSARPNTLGGTDLGVAGAALVLAGELDLPGILGDPAKLGVDALLAGGAVAPTLETRALLKGVLARHWGLSRSDLDKRVFPGSAAVEPI